MDLNYLNCTVSNCIGMNVIHNFFQMVNYDNILIITGD